MGGFVRHHYAPRPACRSRGLEDFYACDGPCCCDKDFVFNVKLHSVELWRCRAVSLAFYLDGVLRQGECTSVKNYRTNKWLHGATVGKVTEECCHFGSVMFILCYLTASS